MHGLTKGAAVLTLASLVAAAPVRAQGAEFSLGGSVGVPLGDFDDAAKIGWHGLAAVSFVPENLPVGFQIDGNFAQFTDETPDGFEDLDVKSQIIFGTANVVFKFKTSEETRFRPYLIGGAGVYNFDLKGDDAPAGDSETEFGVTAGAGFDFKAGSAGLFVEGRFHNAFTDGSDVQFIPITVGIRFGGS